MLEYFQNDEPKVALKLLKLGLPLFIQNAQFILHYLDFLTHRNDVNSIFFCECLSGNSFFGTLQRHFLVHFFVFLFSLLLYASETFSAHANYNFGEFKLKRKTCSTIPSTQRAASNQSILHFSKNARTSQQKTQNSGNLL